MLLIIRLFKTFLFPFISITLASMAESTSSSSGMPCVYEGHLKTDKNWFGYLANVSIVTTGRMTFHFTYQAERCCQNILFYSEDQVAIINARMNCWQKEYLLRPEEDQILRLTPRFSWSGCHVTHPNGFATYVCEGGRSFTVDQLASGPMTWYIAVCNCATLQGLDLQYRLVVYGHVGECRSSGVNPSSSSSGFPVSGSAVANPRSVLMPMNGDAAIASDSSSSPSCVLEGKLNTTSNWYGFLANISLARGGGLRFRFTVPASRHVQNVLLYTENDVGKLNAEQNCWQKEGIIQPNNNQEQVLDLSSRSSWNGCVSREASSSSSSGENELVCRGERRYDEARKMFLAASKCLSRSGLLLEYRLEVYGFTNDLCSKGERGRSLGIPLPLTATVLMIILGC